MTDSGTIEAGKSADLLVLDANPLDDITNTRKISAVYLRGVAVNRARVVSGSPSRDACGPPSPGAVHDIG